MEKGDQLGEQKKRETSQQRSVKKARGVMGGRGEESESSQSVLHDEQVDEARGRSQRSFSRETGGCEHSTNGLSPTARVLVCSSRSHTGGGQMFSPQEIGGRTRSSRPLSCAITRSCDLDRTANATHQDAERGKVRSERKRVSRVISDCVREWCRLTRQLRGTAPRQTGCPARAPRPRRASSRP